LKLAYFDPFSGASGDMILGALVDAGLPLAALRRELAKLTLEGYSLSARKTERRGIAGTKVNVRLQEKPDEHEHEQEHTPTPPEGSNAFGRVPLRASAPTLPKVLEPSGGREHHRRHLSDILKIIGRSDLPKGDKEKASAVFQRLAEAEARVHRCSPEEIHFHEVGAVDAIVDIVGAVVGLRLLGIERVVCGSLRTGTGTVECAHGRLPVPAPATAQLLKGFPSVATDIEGELTTPTGAALLTTLADSFGAMPPMTVSAVGYGAGTADREALPNLLRVFLGEAASAEEADEVVVLEANLDDLSPQVLGYLMERLLEAGALDAFLTPIYMKKNRPGVLVSVIAEPATVPCIEELLFAETTTFGLRRTTATRRKLAREWVEVETQYGKIRVKLGRLGKKLVQAAPEYEDCRRAAAKAKAPLRKVQEAALAAFRGR